MALNEYKEQGSSFSEPKLPGAFPMLPEAVKKRFPDIEKYHEDASRFWRKVRSAISDSNEEVVRQSTQQARAINSISATLNDSVASAISNLNAAVGLDGATSTYILALNAATADLSSAITAEQTARTNADSALASSISTVSAALSTETTNRAAAITAEETARVNGDNALASSISTVSAAVASEASTRAAAITAEQTARADADTALASSITSVSTALSTATTTLSGAITTESTARIDALNAIYLYYAVKLDVGGNVIGSIKLDGSGATSAFTVAADKFQVTNVNGTVTAFDIVAGGNIVFGADAQSDNYDGTDGWRLTRDGDFYAASGTFRGEVNAGSIIGGSIEIPDTGAVNISYSTFQNLGPDAGIGLEIGYYRTGAAPSWVDFHTKDTPRSDYEARLIRDSGVNGEFNMEQTGTGLLRIRHMDDGDIEFDTAGHIRFGVFNTIGATALTGYIEVRDLAGTIHKLAVIEESGGGGGDPPP